MIQRKDIGSQGETCLDGVAVGASRQRRGSPRGHRLGRAVSLPGRRGSPSSPELRRLGDRSRGTLRWFFPGQWLAGHRLSVLGPAGGGGGHEADAGTSAAAAPTAAAKATLGGQRAGDAGGAGGAGLSHQHRASPGACAEQVPAAHDDLGPTQAGATDATRTGATAREGDSAAGEGRAGDQGLRPTHQATAGAAHGCRKERSSVRLRVLHAPSVGWEVRALGGGGPYCLHSQYPLLLLSG